MKKILILIGGVLSLSSCFDHAPTKVVRANLYYNKGLEYNLKNDGQTAILYYDSAIALHHEAKFFNNRGSSKYEIGDTIGAFSDFSLAMYLDSLDFTVILNIGSCYHDRKDYKIALKYYQRSSQINDKQAIFDLMGHCEYMLGNYREALIYFKKHLKGKNPFNPESSYLYMGNCSEKLGDMEAATEYWKKAASLGEAEAQQKLDSINRITH